MHGHVISVPTPRDRIAGIVWVRRPETASCTHFHFFTFFFFSPIPSRGVQSMMMMCFNCWWYMRHIVLADDRLKFDAALAE